MRHISNFFIGVFITNILAIIYVWFGGCIEVCSICGSCDCAEGFTGVIFGFGFMIFASIVSTAGVTLLFIIPGFVLIGLFTKIVYNFVVNIFLPKDTRKNLKVQKQINKISERQNVMCEYINNSRKVGVDDLTIKLTLKNGGWSEKEIENAFK